MFSSAPYCCLATVLPQNECSWRKFLWKQRSTMQQITLNHLALAVKDVNTSVAFYQKVFDFKEIENTASKSKTRWLSLGKGKELHLIPRPENTIKTVKAVHVAFSTNDFDGFIARIESLNIHYSDWLGTSNVYNVRNDNIKQLYFQDPNGYWIEVNDATSVLE